MITTAIAIVIAFLIGGIPTGYIIAKKTAGINIQQYGSGNIGSTNVGRVVGKKASNYTQFLDIGKGLLVSLIVLVLQGTGTVSFHEYVLPMVAFATILGHDFTPFLKFKGGKGVNTTLGTSFLVSWAFSAPVTFLFSSVSVVLAILLYFVVKKVGQYVSLGSLSIAVSLPIFYSVISLIFRRFDWVILIYFLAAGLLMIIRHRENIKRLINKEENKPMQK